MDLRERYQSLIDEARQEAAHLTGLVLSARSAARELGQHPEAADLVPVLHHMELVQGWLAKVGREVPR